MRGNVMSTSKITVFQLVKSGKKEQVKKLVLTPDKFKEIITTKKKQERFKAGRLVRVRQDGELRQYFGQDNRRAASKAA
jgi:hypothetical protein